MNVLIIGSGGREHAIAWKLKQSQYCEKVYVAPGNGGTGKIAINAAIDITDFAEIAKFATDFDIMMVVVGQEAALVSGIHDYFLQNEYLRNIFIVGPRQAGAQLEGSKDFSKEFMLKYNIPTAAYKTFTKDTLEQGIEYLRSHSYPVVLKADGLASGKGVVILDNFEAAAEELTHMLEHLKFGAASSRVVIEEYLKGIELSMFILTDGTDYVLLPEAKDYKQIGEGNTGLNTGGMGAVSPVPFADEAFKQKVTDRIIKPTLTGLQSENIPFSGFLFIGLMNVNGDPYVIEYNVRLGDPETEAILPRIKSDFFELLKALHDKELGSFNLEIDPRTAATVVLVSEGYPGEIETGREIGAIPENTDNTLIFQAGTTLNDHDKTVTNGGRVIAVTGMGQHLTEALAHANATAEKINFQGRVFRKDIGFDLK